MKLDSGLTIDVDFQWLISWKVSREAYLLILINTSVLKDTG